MKILFLFPLLMLTAAFGQNPPAAEESAPVMVTSSRWSRDRKPLDDAVTVTYARAQEMNSANKLYEKQGRANNPTGALDPNISTIDSRSADLDRITQDSREAQPVDGFTYFLKVQNVSTKTIQTIFWEYQFRESANPANLTRHQFLCGARINPEKGKDLQVFSLLGPSNVVNVKSLSKGSADQFQGAVLINRVEFTDGSFWQRKGWSVNDLKLTPKARSESRNLPTCRSL